MRRSRRANPDRNQAEIVAALRASGWLVASATEIGGGFPDLICHKPSTGAWRLVEVKQPKGKVNARQQAFAAHWPVSVIRTPEEAMQL